MQLTINLFLSILKFVFFFQWWMQGLLWLPLGSKCMFIIRFTKFSEFPSIHPSKGKSKASHQPLYLLYSTDQCHCFTLPANRPRCIQKTNYRQTYIQWASCYLLEGNNLADGYDFIMSKIFKAYAYTALTHLPLYLMGKHCRSIWLENKILWNDTKYFQRSNIIFRVFRNQMWNLWYKK